jgi:hypothetical protein
MTVPVTISIAPHYLHKVLGDRLEPVCCWINMATTGILPVENILTPMKILPVFRVSRRGSEQEHVILPTVGLAFYSTARGMILIKRIISAMEAATGLKQASQGILTELIDVWAL